MEAHLSPQWRFYLTEVLGLHQFVKPTSWEVDADLCLKGSPLSDLTVVNLAYSSADLSFAGSEKLHLTEAGQLLEKILAAIGRGWDSIYFVEKLMLSREDIDLVQRTIAELPSPVVLSFGFSLLAEPGHQLVRWKNKSCLMTHGLAELLQKPERKKQTWRDLQEVIVQLR